MKTDDRFWALVEVTGFCWNWTGHQTRDGYGRTHSTLVHRRSYERLVGPIPDGLDLDHLCRNTLCVNPDHLEPVTHEENMRRRYALQRSCVNGHEFDATNTYFRPNGNRDCRACIRDRVRRYKARTLVSA